MQDNFSLFLQKNAAFFDRFSAFSVPSPLFSFFYAASPLKRLIDQDNITAKSLYTVPWYVVFLPPPKQSEEAARSKHNDRLHRAFRQTDLHIVHKPQAAAVADINDLLAPQCCKSVHHNAIHLTPNYAPLGASYAGNPPNMRKEFLSPCKEKFLVLYFYQGFLFI